MNTRIRGKVIAQVAGAGLIAASAAGAAALAVETYQDINHQQVQSAAATAPATQKATTATVAPTAAATTGTADTSATDTSGTTTGTTTDTGAATTYVQAPPVGAGSHGSSSGS